MGYVLKAVLSSAQHPEYGQIILPAPAYWLAGLPAFHSPGIAPAVPAPQTDSSNGHMRKSKQSPHTNLL